MSTGLGQRTKQWIAAGIGLSAVAGVGIILWRQLKVCSTNPPPHTPTPPIPTPSLPSIPTHSPHSNPHFPNPPNFGALTTTTTPYTRLISSPRQRRKLLNVETDLEIVDSWDEADLARMKIEHDAATQSLDYEHQAAVLENMALYYTRKGDHVEAALALTILLNVQEKVYQTSICKERAVTLYKLGLSYGQSGEAVMATSTFERLLELENKLGVVFHQANHPLAAIYIEKGEYAKAQELLEQSFAEGVDQLGYAARKYYDALAVCLLEQNSNLPKAKDLLEHSRILAGDVAPENGGPLEYALALIHLSRYYALVSDSAAAIEHLEEAIGLIKAHAGLAHPDLPGSLSDLARLRASAHDYDGAEEALLECKQTLELGGLENADDIARTQISIDNVRRERNSSQTAPLPPPPTPLIN